MTTLPTSLGRYRVTKKLAQGGMGEVFLGASEAGGPVVLKRLLGDDPIARKRLRDEGRLGQRLAFEPGFVETLDAFDTADGPVLVLEAIDGVPVEALWKVRPLPEGQVAQLGADVAAALRALHGSDDSARLGLRGAVVVCEEPCPEVDQAGATTNVHEHISATDVPVHCVQWPAVVPAQTGTRR